MQVTVAQVGLRTEYDGLYIVALQHAPKTPGFNDQHAPKYAWI